MDASARRKSILILLSRRNYEKIANLAMEFGVSERTIRRDIVTLSLTEPIYTQSGRYGGGVYILNGDKHIDNQCTECELIIINKMLECAKKKIICDLSQSEISVIDRLVTDIHNKTDINNMEVNNE